MIGEMKKFNINILGIGETKKAEEGNKVDKALQFRRSERRRRYM